MVYAEETIQSYLGQFDPAATVADLRYYGPFFSVLSLVGTKAIEAIPLGLEPFQAVHFTYFLSFVLGCVSLYYLLLLFVRWPAAVAGTILFGSQPLLFGHGFINPKDTPMMGFFAATVMLGIYSVRELSNVPSLDPGSQKPTTESSAESPFDVGPPSAKREWMTLGILIVALVCSGIDVGVTHWSLSASVWGLRTAYESSGPRLLTAAFHFIAGDAAKTPLDAYLAKWLASYVCLASLWMAALIFGTAWVTARLALGIGLPALVHRHRGWVLLAAAGSCLGMTISIRVGAIFAGVLLVCLLVWTLGVRCLVPVAMVGLVALVVSVATWPFLWSEPFSRGLASLRVMANFPHEISVLYRGVSFSSTSLPPDYVVGLMLIQFTLPVIPLAAIGLVGTISWGRRPVEERRLLWIIGLWLLVPLLGFVVLRPTLYGTFRQLLFATPPFFVFAGLALDGLFSWLQRQSLQALLVVVVLVPGVAGIVQLHPYEYVYYNAIVGGTGGAYQRYEMDYWCTSLREATNDVNQIARQNEVVSVLFRDTSQVAPFARPDLHIVHARTVNDVLVTKPDEIIACSPGFNFRHADEWTTLAQVSRQGAIFSKVLNGPAK